MELPNLSTPPGGSHPAIRFEQIPTVEGKLSRLEELRSGLLEDVVAQTRSELLAKGNVENLLGEALYTERLRLKRVRTNPFTRGRYKRDRGLWSRVQRDMLRPAGEIDPKLLLDQILSHYADEIGGHFDPRVYTFATRAVPWAFSWLLNAASVSRFLPWGMTQSLESRLRIIGEVPALQNLSRKGTILLVPTHQSNIDSVLLGYVIYLMSLPPFAYGAGLNLFNNPALNFFMSNLGSYTVDRQKGNLIYKQTLKNYSTRILREGIHSIFFPGGGRSRSGAIESKIKLGLLGTGLEAQLEGMRLGSPQPNVYVVPMVMSYHFVLEAGTLIEDYLTESGKGQYFVNADDESYQATKIASFFWKLFSSKTGVTVRIGRPLDIFGNFVDAEGRSVGPQGLHVDPKRWLTTQGELAHDPARDREYTRELGSRLVERFHAENTVLSSHLVAFGLFTAIRKRYPDFDLYRLLRLTLAQRSVQTAEFMAATREVYDRVRELSDRGKVFICQDVSGASFDVWVAEGVKQLGLLHASAVVKVGDGAVWTEDMNLLYYYRNRLAGYGLTLLASGSVGQGAKPGAHDAKGFLA